VSFQSIMLKQFAHGMDVKLLLQGFCALRSDPFQVLKGVDRKEADMMQK